MKKTHPVVISMVAAIFLLSAGSLLAQDPPSSQGTTQNNAATADSAAPSDEDIQLLRKDLRSQKKQIVAANMKLTDAQAEIR